MDWLVFVLTLLSLYALTAAAVTLAVGSVGASGRALPSVYAGRWVWVAVAAAAAALLFGGL